MLFDKLEGVDKTAAEPVPNLVGDQLPDERLQIAPKVSIQEILSFSAHPFYAKRTHFQNSWNHSNFFYSQD